jgi:hypothetical protein
MQVDVQSTFPRYSTLGSFHSFLLLSINKGVADSGRIGGSRPKPLPQFCDVV